MYRGEYSLAPSSASKSEISSSPIRPANVTHRGRPPAAPAALRSPSPAGHDDAARRGAFLRGSDLPVQDQIDALKSALLVTMEELDTLRRDTTVENGKLQMEFRRSIDALVSASETHLLHGGAARSPAAVEASLSASAVRELVSRIDYLENALRLVQSQQQAAGRFSSTAAAAEQAMAPVAVESALRRMAEFMDRADEDIRAAAVANSRAIENWEARFASLQREHDDVIKRVLQQQAHLEEQLEVRTRAVMSPGQEARTHGRTLDGTIDNTATGDNGTNDRMTASAFVTLSQVSNIVNSQIVEVAALMDAEIAKMKETLSYNKLERTQLAQKLDRVTETVSQLDEESREMRRDTELHLKEITKTSATAEEFLKRIEGFVQNFTLEESAAIRDEVLRLVNSDAAVAQRKIDDRIRRDETTAVKNDVIRAIATLQNIQEEVNRVKTQQESLYQYSMRTAHTIESVQHKVDTELRAQTQRIEQQQKAFYSRQEQQMTSERHNMTMKMQEDLRRLQDKHMEELTASEQRRLDDVNAATQQIRDDFAAFVEVQKRDQISVITKVKEDFATNMKQANETLHRNMIATRDEHKRAIDRTIDEYRKLSTHTQDELHRMQHQLEDVAALVKDQTNFARTRVDQLMEQAQARIDNTADEIAGKLNTLVEVEVKQVTNLAMKNALRKIDELAAKTTAAITSLVNEQKSLKATVDAVSVPSNSIKTLDEELDRCRVDITELFGRVAEIKAQEARVIARARDEANSAVDHAKDYITQSLAHQVGGLDKNLDKLRRDLDVRSAELREVASRVDQLNSNILYPRQVPPDGTVYPPIFPDTARDAIAFSQQQQAQMQQQQQQQVRVAQLARSTTTARSADASSSNALDSFLASPAGPSNRSVAFANQQQQQQAAGNNRQPSYRSTSSSSAVGLVLPTPPGAQQQYSIRGSPQAVLSDVAFSPSPTSRPSGRGDALLGAFDTF